MNRSENFKKNSLLENHLQLLNDYLATSEEKILNEQQQVMDYPLILIVGPHRSGSTLFMQWLANTKLFSYPTNLLSRFYKAPVIGTMIQQMLTDPRYNFRDELGEFIQQADYVSENGKTKGALAPNEFWYFWRRFLREKNRDVWTDSELRQTMDTQTMLKELIGIMNVFQKPFAAKGMLFNYNIPFIDEILDKVIFVYLKRDPVTNVASILDARKRQLGSEKKWYSFDIPEYQELKDLDPVTQSAGQLYYINRAVKKGLSNVDPSRKIVVEYEDFCKNPKVIFDQLLEKLGMSEFKYDGPEQFQITRNNNAAEFGEIEKALKKYMD